MHPMLFQLVVSVRVGEMLAARNQRSNNNKPVLIKEATCVTHYLFLSYLACD